MGYLDHAQVVFLDTIPPLDALEYRNFVDDALRKVAIWTRDDVIST